MDYESRWHTETRKRAALVAALKAVLETMDGGISAQGPINPRFWFQLMPVIDSARVVVEACDDAPDGVAPSFSYDEYMSLLKAISEAKGGE
tara:strand:- start:1085 stop:1357 length:273 start_codon:yes stop_codon:yes gene_type:complete